MPKHYFLAFFLIVMTPAGLLAQGAADYAVQLNAATQSSPPQIQLQWKKLSGATGYSVSRKSKGAMTFTQLAVLGASDSSYTDATVVADSAYEYQVSKSGTITASGFIYAAIAAQAQHSRGYCILLVDTLMRDSCRAEIASLMADLRGDGWGVLRHDIARNASPTSVKSIIQAAYNSHTNVEGLLLVGHIPVPYSGNIAPDGHTDHVGAWPADGFYADIDGTWTDASTNNSSASRSQNKNIPGDGKWDQSVIPSDAELAMGRIDFAGMPAISRSEVQLMRNYLNKAHTYKMDSLTVLRKAIIDDNFGAFSGEAFAANAWRAFPVTVGRSNILSADFQTALKDSAYQWAYGCGAGGYNSCSGVGVTADFNAKPVRGIFTMSFGSYFGDWDAQNSFLRAPLCATEPALTSCWAGRPNWFFHHMGLGESIGYSARIAQNNSYVYTPTNHGGSFVHVALMGDPTLRSDYIRPPSGLSISPVADKGANLSWTASPDAGVVGYYVYRSDTAWGTYERVSGLLSATAFADGRGINGKKFYLVRPVKLVQNPSGGYYNLGVGIADSASVTYPVSIAAVTPLRGIAIFPNPATDRLNAVLEYNSSAEANYIVTDVAGRVLINGHVRLHAGTNSIAWDVSSFPPGVYALQLRTADGVMVRKWVKSGS